LIFEPGETFYTVLSTMNVNVPLSLQAVKDVTGDAVTSDPPPPQPKKKSLLGALCTGLDWCLNNANKFDPMSIILIQSTHTDTYYVMYLSYITKLFQNPLG